MARANCKSANWLKVISVLKLILFIQIIHLVVCQTTEEPQLATIERPPMAFPGSKATSFTVPSDNTEDINSKTRTTEIFHEILDEHYDNQIRPPGIFGTGPVVVWVSMFVRNIENLDDVQMEYKTQMTFRQEWIDPRLRYDHLEPNITYLTLARAERIWMPDIFFSNEKEAKLHELMIPNVFTRIFPNGRILQSYRITLLLSCPMNLRSYPLDVQSCPIRLACYGFTTRDVVLAWRLIKGVEMNGDFSMPRFKLQNYSTENCASVTSSGSYACLQLQLRFIRQIGFYLIQIYCPTSMLVLISWVSFWLEPSATEARVSLGVTTILTIVTETYGINQSVPPASYIKATDVWTTACEIMVFSALLQFSVVNYVAHFQWRRVAKEVLSFERDISIRKKKEGYLQDEFMRKAKRIDFVSKILFPTTFITFNIIYWTYYLNVNYTNH